jgi:hypothetical protein
MGAASAASINTTFDFVPFGTLTANNANLTLATSITSGAPLEVTTIMADNTGLVSGQSITLTNPMPLTLGATFVKSWTTALGTFTEDLTVTSVTTGATSLGIDATGMITETTVTSGPALTPAPAFYSAAYTQNAGPGSQINGSFNNSSTPPPPLPMPEPTSIALLGVGLLGLGAAVRRRVRG